MEMNRNTILSILGVCIFIGITGISVGLGAIYTPLNLIAKPVVCPRGEMTAETHVYRPTPGETVTTVTWYCVDAQTGEQAEVADLPMNLFAGTVYGAVLFVVTLAGMFVYSKRQSSVPTETANSGFKPYHFDPNERAERIKSRLEGLERLRKQNKIGDEEYKKRRTRILEDI